MLENIFRSVNIALVNEIAIMCDRMGIDVWEVVNAASTKPYGFMRFEPGPGMGGHCLPVDPFYLSWRAREFDVQTEFIELAGEVNAAHAALLRREGDAGAQRPRQARPGLAGRSPRCVVQGAASPISARRRRSRSFACLPSRAPLSPTTTTYVPELSEFGLASQALDDVLDHCDVAVIVTVHPGLDIERVLDRAPLVVDFRGATAGIAAGKLIRL